MLAICIAKITVYFFSVSLTLSGLTDIFYIVLYKKILQIHKDIYNKIWYLCVDIKQDQHISTHKLYLITKFILFYDIILFLCLISFN